MKVCIFLAEGFEEIEALTVADILRRAKIDTSLVSVTGEKTVTSSHNITVLVDALFEEVNFSQVDMIVLPGGMPGTLNLEAHNGLMEQVEQFYKEEKWMAAICAAPSIFGHKGMLKGRVACSYPDFESHLEGAKVERNQVCVDGNVITSRGMGTAIPFALEICKQLLGEEIAKSVATAIIYC